MKDLLGRELNVGDCVAITTRDAGQNHMRIGTVAELRPYSYTWHKYDPSTRKYTPTVEQKTEIVVDVFMGSGHAFKKSTWDGKKHTYHAHKGYRRTYKNEEHIVRLCQAFEGVSLLEQSAQEQKEAWAEKMNVIAKSMT